MLAVASACQVEMPIPDGANIRCSSDEQCPNDAVCNSVLHRCFGRGSGQDTEPPRVTGATITPAVVSAEVDHNIVTVSFTVDEKLVGDPQPTLTLQVAEGVGRALTHASHDGLQYQYRYDVTKASDGDLDGLSKPIVATLIDRNGNMATDVALGTVAFDFTAPRITGVAALPPRDLSFAQPNGDLEFQVDEDLGEIPQVELIETGAALASVALDNGHYAFRYTVDVADTEGEHGVQIVATDQAGNRGEVALASLFRFDFTAPGVLSGLSSITLTPGLGNRLSNVGAATNGTHVQVSFYLSEPLRASSVGYTVSPSPHVVLRETGVAFTKTVEAGVFYVYDADISGLEPDTELADQIVIAVDPAIVDAAGNSPEQPVVIGNLALDTLPPSALVTTQVDDVVYTRAPWGVGGSPVSSVLRVTGKPDVVAAGTTVIAYSSDDLQTAAELGRAVADDTDGFEMTLTGQDHVRVFLTAVDTAGNQSSPAEVHDVEWVATMGLKRVGVDIENPHQFELRNELGYAMTVVGPSQGDGAGTAALSDRDIETYSPSPVWRQRCNNGGALPGPDIYTSLAYDSVRGRVVGFARGLTDQTWEWDGIKWANMCGTGTGCVGPAQRLNYGMAFDSRRGVMVMYGGSGETDETWEWNGVQWHLLCGSGTSCAAPRPRAYHRMVYDSIRGTVLMFGGQWYDNSCDCYHSMDDLWEWNGQQWHQLCGAGTTCSGPHSRVTFGMTFDEATGRVVVFGGNIGDYYDYIPNDETWEWNGSQWNNVCSASTTPTCTRPSSRTDFDMAYDPDAGLTYLFGGYTGSRSDETWAWNSPAHSWTKVCGAGTSCTGPSGRNNTAMAFDGINRGVLLAGGYTGSQTDEVWLFHQGSWTKLGGGGEACYGPVGKIYDSLVYDSYRGKTVAFGGSDGDSSGWVNDTWEWDGFGWAKVCPTSICTTAPPARYRGAIAYHPLQHKVLYFGGKINGSTASNQTWEYDGTTAVWKLVCPTATCTTAPSARVDTAMAYHAGRGRIVLVGGSAGANEIWELYWDAGSNSWQWTQICLSGTCGATIPTGRSGHAMAYDSDRQRIVLYGGSTTGEETWELTWNKLAHLWSWTKACGTGVCGPGSLYHPGLTYDASSGRTILFGGSLSTIPQEKTWQWDGTKWSQLCGTGTACQGPPSATTPNLAYDAARGEVVSSGGKSAIIRPNQTWIMRLGAMAPAEVFFARFLYAGLESAPTFRSITPTFYAGGDAFPADANCLADPGAELLGWHRGGWVSLASTSDDAGHPEQMTYPITDPDMVGRMFVGGYQSLGFAVRANAASGCGASAGSVAVDYAEVRVKYRSP
ncbi:MAG: hypothetical protein A2289_00415 [Deltaproteobacteria bacterium RIFOXYA12_FULL_58_15]|nr:MAG: hypothetical protein A2289_00415 [Deltaproteobacteria bacterium RIFOXYA12_FULL_58_15]